LKVFREYERQIYLIGKTKAAGTKIFNVFIRSIGAIDVSIADKTLADALRRVEALEFGVPLARRKRLPVELKLATLIDLFRTISTGTASSDRIEQADIGARAVARARMVRVQIAQKRVVDHVQSKDSRKIFLKELDASTGQMLPQNLSLTGLGPKDELFGESEAAWIADGMPLVGTHVNLSVEVTGSQADAFDRLELRVAPEESASIWIHGERAGKDQVLLDKNSSIASVHPGLHDSAAPARIVERHLSARAEVEVAAVGIQGQRQGFLHNLLGKESFLCVWIIDAGDEYSFESFVHPVEIVGNRVHGEIRDEAYA
jgi:hypothetical protein